MQKVSKLTFNKNPISKDFHTEIKKRVKEYFHGNKISKHANGAMIFKTVFILLFYVLTYIMLISNQFSLLVLLAIAGIHGFFTALIGLNIAHDAVHNSYSSNKKINKALGTLFNILGANDYVWKLSHNFSHHKYTNIPDYDDDINQIPILRLNPKQSLWKIHRYQHLYAFFLYPLSSISWVFIKDYKKFFGGKIGEQVNRHPKREYYRLFFFKAFYYTVFLIIPFIVIDLPWWNILLGFVFMHLVEGASLSFVFQLAHVTEGLVFPEPDKDGNMDKTWAAYQMHTTSNFARKSKAVNFLCGGLNFQIEHHLFPGVCHIHYEKLAPIVQQTAKEYGLPYHESETFYGAIEAHLSSLKTLGRNEQFISVKAKPSLARI